MIILFVRWEECERDRGWNVPNIGKRIYGAAYILFRLCMNTKGDGRKFHDQTKGVFVCFNLHFLYYQLRHHLTIDMCFNSQNVQ